jgi:hypothetical protein
VAERWQQWMPFHIDRWRGSPSVQAMHPAAQMGYLNLLCSCWQSADCCVPSDPVDLATESRLGDELWALYGPRILRKFVDVLGRWRNEVLFVEWEEARRVYEKRKSGALRTNSSRTADADRTHSQRNTDTQTLTETETETSTKKQKQAASAFVLPEWIDRKVWDSYEDMRKKIRKPMTDEARILAVGKLKKLESQGHHHEDVLNQSILNSWQGLFEVKTENGGNNGKQNRTNPAQQRQADNLFALASVGARLYGVGPLASDGAGDGSQTKPIAVRTDAGDVPRRVGRDGEAVRDRDVPGRTIEGVA